MLLGLNLILVSPLANSVPTTIPEGTFSRGDAQGGDTTPVRPITLSAFSIDTTEVSVAAFERFFQNSWDTDENWSEAGIEWRNKQPKGGATAQRAAGRDGEHPVVAVTWYEADAYCRSQGGQLPTEAQWERVACSTNGGPFPWGNDEEVDAAWYSGGKYGHIQKVLTRPVGEAPGNQHTPEGVLHTVGNVWEWTNDWYDRDHYATASETDPNGPPKGTWRVLRGGSFMNLPSYCTCTHREPAAPDRVSFTTGFRCAYSDAINTPTQGEQ